MLKFPSAYRNFLSSILVIPFSIKAISEILNTQKKIVSFMAKSRNLLSDLL